jgi:hypothetical protein
MRAGMRAGRRHAAAQRTCWKVHPEGAPVHPSMHACRQAGNPRPPPPTVGANMVDTAEALSDWPTAVALSASSTMDVW